MSDTPLILHATAVAVQGRALLIRGASGRGKSGLALEMMARGAQLVADDRVVIEHDGAGGLTASAPAPLRGLIEARGLGLLGADAVERAELVAVLDLDHEETDRLPPQRHTVLLNVTLPLLHKSASPTFPAALVQYLRRDRRA
ncbi:HPr kinase/phosphatase C-terminal domain-containing protein [Thalassococcus sp. CAU 1522]|uniref:HPr kinase/phosphatase C-terminal domain-containing protein n=1 Tax=Thalassococcus arenae TaxID=2851652 RepID=A0ABS6N877_9RHOB|nr:HPr kinase/phosphatase C-terminal domain-containing protein [Thalassococcus arenae]MBV2359799.1 HPr kinase/phosphatase C-terminal domain-containing protein [Thalassococcus arenae]